MSRHFRKDKRIFRKNKKISGLVVLCLGMGLVLAVVIPFWGWILVTGVGLIVGGWCLIKNSRHR